MMKWIELFQFDAGISRAELIIDFSCMIRKHRFNESLLRSTDGALSWQRLPLPSPAEVYAMYKPELYGHSAVETVVVNPVAP